MRELPILFSGPMVRAILEGRKTMTRRVIKPQPMVDPNGRWTYIASSTARREDGMFSYGVLHPHGQTFTERGRERTQLFKCPYGHPGDQLWVRETWRPAAWRDEGRVAIDYQASPEENRTPWLDVPEDIWMDMWRRMTDEAIAALNAGRGSIRREDDRFRWDRGDSPCRWRPSIHMPRWASRITLEVTGVRVERLQNISHADAISEGIWSLGQEWVDRTFAEYAAARDATAPGAKPPLGPTPVERFKALWDSINGLREPKHIRRRRAKGKPVDRPLPASGPYCWDANPWVWVIEFKRVEREVQA